MHAQKELSIGTLSLSSLDSVDLESLFTGEYDIGFFFPSWDGRSRCVVECAHASFGHAIEIAYQNRGKSGLFEENRTKVLSFLRNCAQHFSSIETVPNDVRATCLSMQAKLREVANYKRRGLRVLVDLSSASRLYALSTVAYGIQSGLVSEFEFLYSEGEYKKSELNQSDRELFSGGRWETIAIPGLEGDFDGGKPFSFLVSVGFEGAKTLRVVNRYEPSQVSVLFPRPGFNEGYSDLTAQRNRQLIASYGVSNGHEMNAEAGDVVAALKVIENCNFEDSLATNCVYLCCGTKPHSLALCIRALALQHPTVLYNKPDRHMENATVPTGRYWRYKIRNRASF